MPRLTEELTAHVATSGTPRSEFDPQAWGAAGSHYLRRDPYWIHRHVETIDVQGSTWGRRRLTIDFSLPAQDAAIVERGRDCNLYCMPIALLPKEEPRAMIDLLDEAGGRLPLLTRAESELIALFAIRRAVYDELGKWPSEAMMKTVLPRLMVQSGRTAEAQFHVFDSDAEESGLARAHGYPFLREFVRSLTDDWIVWHPVVGCPGERRSVRLAHQVELGRTIVAEQLEESVENVEFGAGPARLSILRARGINRSVTAGRAVDRVLVRLGLAAHELEIRRPAIAGAASYHLQVQAPPGLRTVVTRTKVQASLEQNGPRPLHVEAGGTPQYVHLYVTNHSVVKPGPVLVALRPTRIGLIGQSSAACLLIATMLWFFAAHWQEVSHRDNSQTSAAILLITPAVLAALVYRGSEHLMVARLLAGVRALVIVAGTMSVASAASLVGAVRFGMPPERAAYVYAGVATLAALYVSGVWVRWLPWERSNESILRSEWAAALIFACAFSAFSISLVVPLTELVGWPRLVLRLSLSVLPLVWVGGFALLRWHEPAHFFERGLVTVTCVVLAAAAILQATESAARSESLSNVALVLLGILVIRAGFILGRRTQPADPNDGPALDDTSGG